jgi:yidC_oxa1_cterm: membrane protein insertase, YidC/Oxa1 family
LQSSSLFWWPYIR